jgi:nitrite reductase/ring-hydroxylating ferredoxin subunit
MLTDVVIGSFTSATLIDLIGGDRDGRAANRLTAIGIAAYGPTALTGVSDWADTEEADEGVRRVGLIHATTNSVALASFAAALVARRRGRRGRGRLLSIAGSAALGAAGYLGGHLSFVQGVGPNQTVFDAGPHEWTDVASIDELEAGVPVAAQAGETPVLLVRTPAAIRALHDRCSHRGCPLSDGEIDGEAIVCGCHGSRFALRDGAVLKGPATAPQPAFEARESEGRIQVRRAPND